MLNFSKLSDDQLVSLVQETLCEAARRGRAVQEAAEEICLSEDEKLRIEQTAFTKERDRILSEERAAVAAAAAEKARREIIERRRASGLETPTPETEQQKNARLIHERFELEKKILAELASILGPLAAGKKWWIEVWNKNGEKRLFIGTRGCKFRQNEIDYYHTGKLSKYDQVEPRTLKAVSRFTGDPSWSTTKTQLEDFCERLCAKYDHIVIGSKGS